MNLFFFRANVLGLAVTSIPVVSQITIEANIETTIETTAAMAAAKIKPKGHTDRTRRHAQDPSVKGK
ncbi:hypothetical protein [Budvicia diplopodorum]|uniref:hypothetical protein n=1 Tax=Budvicia diplopodorum TaxID=1119056 RepID=UPI001359AADD|nr:hypothetical protein [Budvicia diplopodorum]